MLFKKVKDKWNKIINDPSVKKTITKGFWSLLTIFLVIELVKNGTFANLTSKVKSTFISKSSPSPQIELSVRQGCAREAIDEVVKEIENAAQSDKKDAIQIAKYFTHITFDDTYKFCLIRHNWPEETLFVRSTPTSSPSPTPKAITKNCPGDTSKLDSDIQRQYEIFIAAGYDEQMTRAEAESAQLRRNCGIKSDQNSSGNDESNLQNQLQNQYEIDKLKREIEDQKSKEQFCALSHQTVDPLTGLCK